MQISGIFFFSFCATRNTKRTATEQTKYTKLGTNVEYSKNSKTFRIYSPETRRAVVRKKRHIHRKAASQDAYCRKPGVNTDRGTSCGALQHPGRRLLRSQNTFCSLLCSLTIASLSTRALFAFSVPWGRLAYERSGLENTFTRGACEHPYA